MKKQIVIVLISFIFVQFASAQFEIGLRAGISTQDVNTESLDLDGSLSDLRINLVDASYGYHFGLYGQFKLAGLTFSPEVIFNSNQYEYRLQEFDEGGVIDKIVTDRYQYVDVPLLVGVKLGPLRAYAGPEIHYMVNSYSKLIEEDGFSQQVDKVNYGAIVGAGVNVSKLRLDVRYELNFDNFEDHLVFNGSALDFNTDDSRLIFSLGYKLN